MNGAAGCASPTRAIAGGGFDGGIQEEVDYVEIMTLGNAKDFGNLAEARSRCWCMFKWSWRFIMSEFKVDAITNRDGSLSSTSMWYYHWKFWYDTT